jgi:hypothetical protein
VVTTLSVSLTLLRQNCVRTNNKLGKRETAVRTREELVLSREEDVRKRESAVESEIKGVRENAARICQG